MKHLLTFILACVLSNYMYGQKTDTVSTKKEPMSRENWKVFMGPNRVNSADLVFIVNDLLIRDTAIAYPLISQFRDGEIKISFYNKEQTIKKFGLESKVGAMYCQTRNKVLIDVQNQKIVRR